MKVSIITVVYNAVETLEKSILSVISQGYSNIEYIIIDGLLEIDDNIIPIQFQVNISKVKESDHGKIFKITSVAFNRTISFNRPKKEPKKPWWKVW